MKKTAAMMVNGIKCITAPLERNVFGNEVRVPVESLNQARLAEYTSKEGLRPCHNSLDGPLRTESTNGG